MFYQKFNQAYFEIKLSEIEDESISVLSFEGNERISGLFEYRIEIISKDSALDSSKILNKPATLSFIRGDDAPEKIHGIISHFEQHGRTTDYTFYKVHLAPRLWRLNLVYQNEVYQQMKINEIVSEILSDGGLTGSSYKIDLKGQYPKHEYIVQYRETNFDFINRRLEHFGIFYYFDHSGSNDVVVFTDTNSKLPEIHSTEPVGFNENKDALGDSETIVSFSCNEKVVTGAVQLKDYNYLFPEKQLIGESQINSNHPGIYYDYGDNFENEKDAEFLAKIRNQEFIAQSKIFQGLSDSRLLRAGYRFKLESHFRDDWNDEYIITEVSIRGAQYGLFGNLPESTSAPTYECTFKAIPFSIDYRPERKTPIPKISGIMSAKIESGSGDEYAFIDDHGRYKAKMLFDISDKSNGEASLPLRLNQGYSGPGYGIHFPNHTGTELLWACIDGNVDRPIGLGTVPNPSNASPSVGGNKSQSVIRTAGQNELSFDDKTGNENIYLHGTKDWTIDIANDKTQKIGNDETSSVGRNRTRDVGKDENISIKDNQSESIGKNHTLSIGGDSSISISGNLSESVGKNLSESVGENASISVGKNQDESIGENLSLSVGKNLSESVGKNKSSSVGENFSENIGKNYSSEVANDADTKVGKKFKLQAGDDISVTGGKKGVIDIANELTLKCGSASIILKKNGDVQIKGKNINVQGSGNIKIKGSQIAEN